MSSTSRVLPLGFLARLGIGLVLLVNAGVQAWAMDKNSAHSPTQALANCDRAKARFSATLDYSAPKPSDFTNPSLPPPSDLMPSVVFHLHYPDKSNNQLPSLDELGCILDQLLGQFINEHHDAIPARFEFSPGAIREALIGPLGRSLVKPGANWDVKRGVPRHGRFGSVLNDELKQVIQRSPIAKAFEAHGYRLVFNGIIGGIDIQPVKALGGAMVPVSVYEMDMVAVKIAE